MRTEEQRAHLYFEGFSRGTWPAKGASSVLMSSARTDGPGRDIAELTRCGRASAEVPAPVLFAGAALVSSPLTAAAAAVTAAACCAALLRTVSEAAGAGT